MRLALCLLIALLSGGCFAFDEIEKGQEILAAHTPDSEQPEGSAKADGLITSARKRLAEYYAKQRAKAGPAKHSHDPGDAIGQCLIGSDTRFLRKTDCHLRGGRLL